MIKKPSNNYESPLIELLSLEENDVIIMSGDNFFKWHWDDDKPLDIGLFN